MTDPTTSTQVPAEAKPQPGVYGADLRRLSFGELWRMGGNPVNAVFAMLLLKVLRIPFGDMQTRQRYPSPLVVVDEVDVPPDARAAFERDAPAWRAGGFAPAFYARLLPAAEHEHAYASVWRSVDGRAIGQTGWTHHAKPNTPARTVVARFIVSRDERDRRLVATNVAQQFDPHPSIVAVRVVGAEVPALIDAHRAASASFPAQVVRNDEVLARLVEDADLFLEHMIARGVFVRIEA